MTKVTSSAVAIVITMAQPTSDTVDTMLTNGHAGLFSGIGNSRNHFRILSDPTITPAIMSPLAMLMTARPRALPISAFPSFSCGLSIWENSLFSYQSFPSIPFSFQTSVPGPVSGVVSTCPGSGNPALRSWNAGHCRNPGSSGRSSLLPMSITRILSRSAVGTCRIDLSPELPLVMADGRRIIQVLNNLLTNAARYSHEASAIGVTAVREGYHVAVSVTDEGRGIAAERLPHLFRKFSRLEGEDRGRDIAGSGLGLAICKGIVEAHGGRIWAESDGPGLGARFTFTIPVAQDAGIGAANFPVRSRRSERERERILAVDDDPQTLRHVRDALTNAGYAPVLTGDPEEALSLVEANDPHLVLLDLMLPGTDGIELMRGILDMADVPVIFLSAYGQEETIARAFENGADDYVIKPFSPMELVARIKAALRKRESPEWTEPSEPFVLGELTIDHAERRVTLAGRPVQLTAIEYRLLFELSANAGRVMTYDRLLRRVWGLRSSGDSRRVRTAPKQLRRKLGDDANNPTYILNEPRVGYRMAEGEETGEATP